MPSGASGPAGERHTRRSGLRFSRLDRLRKRFEYRRLRDQGRRVHTRSFVLLIARSEYGHPRLGITVSRQVGNAVARNRVKRLLREAFRQERSLFPPAADVVVIAKAGCLPLSLSDVQHELAQVGSALRAAWNKPVRSRSLVAPSSQRAPRAQPGGGPP